MSMLSRMAITRRMFDDDSVRITVLVGA